MKDSTVSNKRIAKNAIYLYLRLLITMFCSFYTSKVILEVLGVEDFGIYNVVGGVTLAITFFTGSLTSVAQRYFNLGLGTNDSERTNQYFNQFLLIFGFCALLVLLVGECVSYWIVNSLLNIPAARIEAAMWVYQFSLLSLVLSLFQIPYQSAVIAHEKMGVFAFISLFETVSRLIILYLILALDGDRLIEYGLLYFLTCVIVLVSYMVYSHVRFSEIFLKFYFNKPLMKEMSGFVGYNMYGGFAFAMCEQGVDVLFNIFFGPAINAARALTRQVDNGIYRFSDNILSSVRPPIIKLYSQGNYKHMLSLAMNATRYCLFINILLVVPIIVNVDFILTIWLKTVPAFTGCFIIIVLIQRNIYIANNMLIVLATATGDLRRSQLYGRTFTLLALPISYVALLIVKSPVTPMVIILLSTIFFWLNNIRDCHIQVELSYKEYLVECVLPPLKLCIPVFFVEYFLSCVISEGWACLIYSTVTGTILGLVIIYFFLLRDTERDLIHSKAHVLVQKFKTK